MVKKNPRGRPRSDESPWAPYIGHPRAHPAMKALAAAADRKGLSMRAVARLAGRDERALPRNFESMRPRIETVTAIAEALDFPPIVARALLGQLTDRDVAATRPLMNGEISIRGKRLFGEQSAAASTVLQMRWPSIPEGGQRRILARYILAKAGLEPSDHEILGTVIGAIHEEVVHYGVSLQAMVADPDAISAAIDEGIDWFLLMYDAFGLSAEDTSIISRVLDRYVPSRLKAAPRVWDYEARREARDAARAARRASLARGQGGAE